MRNLCNLYNLCNFVQSVKSVKSTKPVKSVQSVQSETFGPTIRIFGKAIHFKICIKNNQINTTNNVKSKIYHKTQLYDHNSS